MLKYSLPILKVVFFFLGLFLIQVEKLQLEVDGRIGIIKSTQGILTANTQLKEDITSVISINGENNFTLGYSTSLSLKYQISKLIALGLNAEYLSFNTDINYISHLEPSKNTVIKATNQTFNTSLVVSLRLYSAKNCPSL